MLFLQVNPQPATGEGGIDIIYIIFNLLLVLPLGWGAYKGYEAGLLAEFVGILHFAIAFAISIKVIGVILTLIDANIFRFHDALLAPVAFGCAVGAAFGLLATLGKYMKTEIEYDFPGAWDNIIGAAVGLVKYAIVLSFFFWFLSGFGTLDIDLSGKSPAYNIIETISHQMMGAENATQVSQKIKELL